MTKLLWLIGGTGLALAVFAILNSPDFVPAGDGVERAAGKLLGWGSKQRATGTGGKLIGKVEALVGDVSGNPDTQDKGTFDQATGALKDAAGQAAEALGNTLHDLNKV